MITHTIPKQHLTNALCHRQLRENVAGIMRFELVIMVK